MDANDRTDPPLDADEATTVRAYLDYHRDTLRWKVSGLDQEQLARTLAPSSMTLGGLVKHLALEESSWFEVVLAVARADRAIDEAASKPTGLGTPSAKPTKSGDGHFSLRWILLHMVEEYARHNGHADLLRESIDGETGE